MVDEFQCEFVVTISDTITGSTASTMLPTKFFFSYSHIFSEFFKLVGNSAENPLRNLTGQ